MEFMGSATVYTVAYGARMFRVWESHDDNDLAVVEFNGETWDEVNGEPLREQVINCALAGSQFEDRDE